MPEAEPAYQSYILRLWRADPPAGGWRVMLENIGAPGERHYFKDLESLTAYLKRWQVMPEQDTNQAEQD